MRVVKNLAGAIILIVPRDWKRNEQEKIIMKKIFSDYVPAVGTAIFACSLAVGMAVIYAMDKFV